MKIDGQLDEEAYLVTRPMGDFIQTEPNRGEPATEQTEVWHVLRRGQHLRRRAVLRLGAAKRWVANEMRRDSNNIFQNDNFAFSSTLSTTGATAFLFEINSDRRPLRRTGHQRAASQQRRLEPGVGARSRAASTGGGRSKWPSRSSRCATDPGDAGVGLQRRAARSAGRTRSRSSRAMPPRWRAAA